MIWWENPLFLENIHVTGSILNKWEKKKREHEKKMSFGHFGDVFWQIYVFIYYYYYLNMDLLYIIQKYIQKPFEKCFQKGACCFTKDRIAR